MSAVTWRRRSGRCWSSSAGVERDRHRHRPPADPQQARPGCRHHRQWRFHFVADGFDSYEPRDRILAAQAPIQLILQIVVWLAVYELGFALLLWPTMRTGGLAGAFALAGSSLCTLGYLAPHNGGSRVLADIAALVGLGTVALQIGYLPTLYAAFNRREGLVTMLDSRAGVPSWGPELLARTHYGLGSGVSAMGQLPELFEDWERWSADVSESHATYLPLTNFRSPRPLSSWLTAQLAVLDAAALYLSLLPDAAGAVSARLCLRGGFTCLGTIARARGIRHSRGGGSKRRHLPHLRGVRRCHRSPGERGFSTRAVERGGLGSTSWDGGSTTRRRRMPSPKRSMPRPPCGRALVDTPYQPIAAAAAANPPGRQTSPHLT